jgi:hypothetical protein
MKKIVISGLLALSFLTGFTCSKNTPSEQTQETAPAQEQMAAPTAPADANGTAAPAEGTATGTEATATDTTAAPTTTVK